ncbi:MAG: YitT family protein [Clostridia bacterium]|nr:YitT family protein [Clostridia bacterium]
MRSRIMTWIREYALLTFASAVMSVGIYFFEFLNGFTTGGVSGFSLILSAYLPKLSAGMIMLTVNLLLLAIGFLVVGKEFGLKTFFCSIAVSFGTLLLELWVPRTAPLTDEPMLETIFMVLLPAFAMAIMFYLGASSGGTDIIAMILKKYFSLNISNALFFSDLLIVFFAFAVFGIEAWLFSLFGFFLRILLINLFLKKINASKYCTVITSPKFRDIICDYITNELKRSATVSEEFIGAYHNEKKSVLLSALTRRQAGKLKEFTKTLDEKILIIISETSEITGNGFREML